MTVATVAELKTFLNKTVSTDDSELQTFLDRAQSTIEDLTGPLELVTVEDEEHECPDRVLLPRVVPLVSVQSVTYYPGATEVPPRDLDAGTDGYRIDGWDIYYRFPSNTAVLVSYTAGRETLKPKLKQAVLELAAHDWRTSQTKRPGSPITGESPDPARVTPHLLPYRVAELIGKDLLPSEFA